MHTCATLLQTESSQDLLKFGMCAELGQLNMHTTTQASTQIRGAGQDVTKMLVPHESMVVLLEDLLNLCKQVENLDVHLLSYRVKIFLNFGHLAVLPSADQRKTS